jgi:ABC-type phosphate/phosphonate transport system substrate-binding protein
VTHHRRRGIVGVLLAIVLAGACGEPPSEPEPAPEPAPRPTAADPSPEPTDPPEPPPAGWPDPLIVGVFPTDLDAEALRQLDVRLSGHLPVRVRTAVLRDSASLADSLAADRIAVALLDPLDAVTIGVPVEGLPQAVRAAGRLRPVVWVGVDPARWCPEGIGDAVLDGPAGSGIAACAGVPVDPPGFDAPDASTSGLPVASGPEASEPPADGVTDGLLVDAATAAALLPRLAGLGDPPPEAVDDDAARRALDEGALVAMPLDVAALLEPIGERVPVVVAWGPLLPTPLLVPGPGLPAEAWEAFSTALAEVMRTPHGAEALLDTLGIEGWAPVDDAVVDRARSIVRAGQGDDGPPGDEPGTGDED